jgi:hypothetical protein
MTSPRPLTIAVMTVALLSCTAAVADGATPYRPRPHADFSMRDMGLRIARFDAFAQPHGNRIRVGVTLTARSRAQDLTAVLRIGRCTGGPPTSPICDPNASEVVRFHPGRTTIAHMTAVVPRPDARTDAIRISLTPRGVIVRPYRSRRAGIVDMLLPSSAWTAFAQQAFGLRVSRPWEGDALPYDLRSVGLRAAQIDRDRLRASLRWSANAPPATTVTTVAGRCVPADAACAALVRQTTATPARTATFSARPTLRRVVARQTLLVDATTPDGYLFTLKMPWPR